MGKGCQLSDTGSEPPKLRRLSRALPGSSVATSHASGSGKRHWTSRLLHSLGEAAAHSAAGFTAATLVILWLGIGGVAGFPGWWSTVLYGWTASVTFVMVFVIQHTSERQTSAMQRKLDELIRSSTRADDGLIAVEEATDEQLHAMADLSVAEGAMRRR